MPPRSSLFLSLGLVALMAGCQFQLPGKGSQPGDVTPNAVAGDAIEVTALDAPPPDDGAAPPPAGEGTSKPQSAPPEAAADPAAEPAPEPAPQPDLGQDEAVAEEPAAEAEAVAEPPPEPAKSDLQIACEKKKGTWSSAGGKAHICIFRTKDADKSCTKGTQCEGDCLARSGTCSPIRPLLGCNDILQDDGSRVTLCID